MKLCDLPRTEMGGMLVNDESTAWYTFARVTVNGCRRYVAIYHDIYSDEKLPDGLLTDSATTTSELIERIEKRHPHWTYY